MDHGREGNVDINVGQVWLPVRPGMRLRVTGLPDQLGLVSVVNDATGAEHAPVPLDLFGRVYSLRQ